jgi:hypothetical protein
MELWRGVFRNLSARAIASESRSQTPLKVVALDTFHLNDQLLRRWRYPATSGLLRGVTLRDMTCDLMTLTYRNGTWGNDCLG